MKEDHRSYRRNFAVAKRKPESLFATAKPASITAMIFFHIILHPAVLIYDFHTFITSVTDELASSSLPMMPCASLKDAGKQKPSSPFARAFSCEFASRLGFSEGSSLL